MKICVDQDEVLAQFVNCILHRWNERNGTSFSRDQVNVWRMETVLGIDRPTGRSAEGFIDEWMTEPGFFESLEPMPGAVEGFNALRAMGHDVIVATSVPEVAVNAFDGKRRWMRRHFPDWSMKNFVGCSRKGLLVSDFLIDDGDHNIKDRLESGQGGCIVYDAPWNRGIPVGDRVLRFRGWDEIVQFFRAVQEVERVWFEGASLSAPYPVMGYRPKGF